MKPFAFWYKRNGPQLQTYHTMLTKRYQWKLPVNFRLALSYRMWPKGQRSTYPNLIAWNAIKWAPNDKMCATADCLLPPRIGRKRKDSSKVTNSLVFLLDSSFFFFLTRLGISVFPEHTICNFVPWRLQKNLTQQYFPSAPFQLSTFNCIIQNVRETDYL